jgi:hypothetical protein
VLAHLANVYKSAGIVDETKDTKCECVWEIAEEVTLANGVEVKERSDSGDKVKRGGVSVKESDVGLMVVLEV